MSTSLKNLPAKSVEALHKWFEEHIMQTYEGDESRLERYEDGYDDQEIDLQWRAVVSFYKDFSGLITEKCFVFKKSDYANLG